MDYYCRVSTCTNQAEYTARDNRALYAHLCGECYKKVVDPDIIHNPLYAKIRTHCGVPVPAQDAPKTEWDKFHRAVEAKLNVCTCGAAKTYGQSATHDSWCNLAETPVTIRLTVETS